MLKPAVPDRVADPVSAVSSINVPNFLTTIRLLVVPVLAWLLFQENSTTNFNRTIAGVLFIVAALTDIADGTIARKWNLITNFGKIFDPIADKALIGTALIGLSSMGLLDWWFTWVILAREIFVTLLRFWVIKQGVIPASRGGKLKTIMQIVAISFYLLPLPSSVSLLAEILMYVAVILTLATAVDYIMKAIMTDRDE
ncbi:MAG: CDP-diacylglycerol--glycerol-3-phosphate 3-phosphatidyltransferase [Candidatus Nanopelagicales bacterium]|nr:CDP-diacylglycerol--glycerol-3-phosphate 3-phosphatidyltransferase [Candidatus Nanopelagicales bacterium]MDP4746803.1 CDP-diacylglycerol--glycerol-3-phosphate 3-phosphatidyltransferase [Candidatus Nanopelagicales bacterium]MDP4986007.1 CDP-diacylglycerol--glycerol-3-phosphate 3-phosphatidyltransferase [Candidatus Nanopelagicales bacterium]MDP5107500.1 CDP-diacylglycerol--glycerol-3-phosphate 3-phosphatidyltransferase [Candidatus Nanopelagicales bacterium]